MGGAGGVVAQGALSPEYPESGGGGLFSTDWCWVDVHGGVSSVVVSDDEVLSSCTY